MKRLLMLGCVLLGLASVVSAQTVSADRFRLNTTLCTIYSGSGSPESAVTGKPCDLYVRSDASASNPAVYTKLTGTGNTGWSAVLSTGGSGGVSGSGTSGYLAQWTGTGTVGNGPVASNVPLLDANNSFTGSNTFTQALTLSAGWPTSANHASSMDYVQAYAASRGLNLFTNGSGMLGSNYNMPGTTFLQSDTHGGAGSFTATSYLPVTSTELIPVDPTKYYWGSFWVKELVDASKTLYAGAVFYDIDGLEISTAHVMWISGTQTTLAAPLTPGDTTITLTDATGWYVGANVYQRAITVYPYTSATGYTYADYTYSRFASYLETSPNYKSLGTWAQTTGISGNVITLTGAWPASLGNPDDVNGTWPAGTAVANSSLSGYQYFMTQGSVTPTSTWTQYGGMLYGTNLAGTGPADIDAFWPGVAYMRLLFLMNYAGTSVSEQAISDIHLSYAGDPATTLFPGVVSTGTQSFAGNKTFTGSVGIGTAPSTLLHLAASSTGPVQRIENTTSGGTHVAGVYGAVSFYTADASGIGAHETAAIKWINTLTGTTPDGQLAFYTGVYNVAAAERVRINSTGVGIGTDAPSYSLDVLSTADDSWATRIYNSDADNGYGLVVRAGDDGNVKIAEFRDVTDAAKMTLLGNGNVGIGTTDPKATVQIGSTRALYMNAYNPTLGFNAYYDYAAPGWKYGSGTLYAGVLDFDPATTGGIRFRVSTTKGAADAALTLVNALVLDKDSDATFSGDIFPSAADSYDLGSYDKLWRTGYLSELRAILFAKSVTTIIGDRWLIAKNAGKFATAVGSGDATIDFGTAMDPGDFVEVRADDAAGSIGVEYIEVGSNVSGTTYNVTRNLDGSGANAWTDGTPFAVLGADGDARIVASVNGGAGVIDVIEQGATYDASTLLSRMGDLNGSYGYGAPTLGFAAGVMPDDVVVTTGSWVTVDPTNGVRMLRRASSTTSTRFQLAADGSGLLANSSITWDTSGNLTVAGNATIAGFSVNATELYAGTAGTRVQMTAAGGFHAGATAFADAPFSVSTAGALKSTSGTIGGFTLASNLLSSGTDADYVAMSSAGTNAFWAGDSTFADAEFSVTAAGVLKATSATITGTVNATAGYFGSGSTVVAIESSGINVGASGAIRGGQTAYATGTGFWLGYDTSAYKLSIGSSTDYLTWDGTNLTANNLISGTLAVGPFAGFGYFASEDVLQIADDSYISTYDQVGSTKVQLMGYDVSSNSVIFGKTPYSPLGYRFDRYGDDTNFTIGAGGITAKGSLSISGRSTADMSSTQAQDDVDVSNAAVFILTATHASGNNISGFAGGVAGRMLTVCNRGAYTVTFKHDTTSTAANRIYAWAGADSGLGVNKCAQFWYDATLSRWLQVTLG